MKDFLLAMVAVILAATPKSAVTRIDKSFFFHGYVIHIRPKASEGRTTHLTSHLHCLSGVCWHPVKKKIISFNSRAMCVRVHSKVPIMGLTFSVTSGLVEALTAGLLLIRPSF